MRWSMLRHVTRSNLQSHGKARWAPRLVLAAVLCAAFLSRRSPAEVLWCRGMAASAASSPGLQPLHRSPSRRGDTDGQPYYSATGGHGSEVAGRAQSSRLSRVAVAASSADSEEDATALLRQAIQLECERGDLLISQLDMMDKESIEEELSAEELKEIRERLQKAESPGGLEGDIGGLFKALQKGNNKIQDVMSITRRKEEQEQRQDEQTEEDEPSTPSYVPKWANLRIAGLDVVVEPLPSLPASPDSAVMANAPRVRVSLPLGDMGGFNELLWGADVTPFFDTEGARIMVFTVRFMDGPSPVGLDLRAVPRPDEAPDGEGQVIVVDSVLGNSEAEIQGIQAGDYVRAFSYVKEPETNILDDIMGYKPPAELTKAVVKCDAMALDEVEEQIRTNKDSPDGEVTLLLERPLSA